MSDLYARRDVVALGYFYAAHVSAMTTEGLEAKSAIAAELAHRDARIAALEAEVYRLRCALVGAGVPREMVDLIAKGAAPPKPEPPTWDGRSWPTFVPPGRWAYCARHAEAVAPTCSFNGGFRLPDHGEIIFVDVAGVEWDHEDLVSGEYFVPLDDNARAVFKEVSDG